MGIKDAWDAQIERSKNSAIYSNHVVNLTTYSYLPIGRFKRIERPVSGLNAEFESGSDVGGRTTLTRVAAGAIIAGPIGAVVGGLFKKDRNRAYVTMTFPDGDIVIVDGPAKDELKLKQFAIKANAISARAQQAD